MKNRLFSKTFGKKNVFGLSLWQAEHSANNKCLVFLLPTILWRGGFTKKEFSITIRFLFWGIGLSCNERPCGCQG